MSTLTQLPDDECTSRIPIRVLGCLSDPNKRYWAQSEFKTRWNQLCSLLPFQFWHGRDTLMTGVLKTQSWMVELAVKVIFIQERVPAQTDLLWYPKILLAQTPSELVKEGRYTKWRPHYFSFYINDSLLQCGAHSTLFEGILLHKLGLRKLQPFPKISSHHEIDYHDWHTDKCVCVDLRNVFRGHRRSDR